MSKQTNAANPPRSMVTHPGTSPPSNNTLPRHCETDGETNRPNDTQMNEGRVSGEQLEGSTLGSSSRDGERGARGQRRTQNSSSFLLDSAFIPRSKSLRASQHRPRRSEPDRGREKRGPPEVEHTGSRKKGRFPWSRHRHFVEASSSEVGGTEPGSSTVREERQPSDIAHLDERDEEEDQEEPSRASVGLDQDSIQIVNLALNLSESRRRGNFGRSASHRVASSVHSHAPVAVGVAGNRGRSQTQRSFPQSLLDDSPRQPDFHAQQPPANGPLSVSSLLPNAVDDTFLPQDISESTLARVAKARRHFELFGEYLRLLPSLPPLRSHNPGASANGDAGSSRAYNPLQTIRNRKVRYREKCPINIEVEGWHDLTAVHEWVDTVGQQYGQQARDPVECIRLPHLRQDHSTSLNDPEDAELLAAVSPDNVKQAKRSSSKTRRPRFDWLVPPAELLADAAWVEDDLNKSKVVDKDGNSIYPDPAELAVSDANDASSIRQASLSGKRVSLDVPSRASFTDSPRGGLYDHAGFGRGRPRHRLRSPSSGVHSSSVSTKDRRVKQRGSIIRSHSSSSISDGVGLSERSGFSSPLSARMTDPDDTKTKPAQIIDSPSYRPKRGSAWVSHEHKRTSMSSAASTDDRHNRMSLDAMRSTAPNSPPYPGFFPSITTNLSPQSSRSPSPTKKRFSRKIGPRHERAKSKNRPAEARDSLDSEFLRKRNTPSQPDATDRPGNLEPSPLTDQIAPVHQDEQAMDDTAAAGRTSGQYESKLRGMFKGKGKRGKGKLASLVGTEVSKVGDFILKKDHSTHSRQSSFATSATSDDADADAVNNGKTSVPKSLLRRLPTLSDDSGRVSRKDAEKYASKSNMPLMSTLASPSKQNDHEEQRMASDLEGARENFSRAQDAKQPQKKPDDAASAQQGKFNPDVSVGDPNETFGIGPSLRIVQEQNKKRQIKDPSVPFSLTRPPVTGLAQAEASLPPSAQEKRPTLSGTWTISDRSIPTLADLGVFEKREIERTRALLLSSGIKAREITRRAETIRDPAPEFLQNSADSEDAPIPRVTRLREFDLAAQNLQRRFERSRIQFQQSMDRFPTKTASPLKTKLDALENLVSQSLAPRVRAAGSDAESLSIQLNTTSTLALKQLSDTLDKGVRMRRRRLRWVRRAGFVMLEWALVGMLWWVWLLVMAFKVLRSVFRGAVSGIRWVLWL